MPPVRLPLTWRDPIIAFAPLAERPGALLLASDGDHPLGRFSFLTCDPVRRLTWRASDGDAEAFLTALRALRGATRTVAPGLPPFCGGVAGLFCYELGGAFERLPPPKQALAWPLADLGLYDQVAAFDHQRRTAEVIAWSRPGEGEGAALGRAEAFAAALATSEAPGPARLFAAAPAPVLSRAQMEARIARARAYVHAGDIFQTNIAQPWRGWLAPDAAPFDLLRQAGATTPFAAYWRGAQSAVVSFSPERFIEARPGPDGVAVETRPIKGTRPRAGAPDIDRALAEALRASAKDRAENLMIVDLMRNDLARVSIPGSVRAPRLMALESHPRVHHLVSIVTAHLAPERDAADLLRAAFPGGSVTGAPKVRAMEIIHELEDDPRGPYCGSLGYWGFDGAMDLSILIRTLSCRREKETWRVELRAGGGIVADSDPAAEYDETLTKANSVLQGFAMRLEAAS